MMEPNGTVNDIRLEHKKFPWLLSTTILLLHTTPRAVHTRHCGHKAHTVEPLKADLLREGSV